MRASGFSLHSGGQQDNCATQQDLDDASALLTAAEAELELMQAQSDAEYAEYCSANPEECNGEERIRSGPAGDDRGCGDKYFAAGVSVGASLFTVASAKSLLTGARVGYLAAIALGGVAGIAVGVTAVIVTAAYTCYMASGPTWGLLAAEPEYD